MKTRLNSSFLYNPNANEPHCFHIFPLIIPLYHDEPSFERFQKLMACCVCFLWIFLQYYYNGLAFTCLICVLARTCDFKKSLFKKILLCVFVSGINDFLLHIFFFFVARSNNISCFIFISLLTLIKIKKK